MCWISRGHAWEALFAWQVQFRLNKLKVGSNLRGVGVLRQQVVAVPWVKQCTEMGIHAGIDRVRVRRVEEEALRVSRGQNGGQRSAVGSETCYQLWMRVSADTLSPASAHARCTRNDAVGHANGCPCSLSPHEQSQLCSALRRTTRFSACPI